MEGRETDLEYNLLMGLTGASGYETVIQMPTRKGKR